MTVSRGVFLLLIFLGIMSCTIPSRDTEAGLPVVGTWRLVKEMSVTGPDTVITRHHGDVQETLKMINPTHFTFLRHDLQHGKDSVKTFVAGGGRYALQGNQYTEHLDFCNYREWEGHTFTFELTIKGDTLVQLGREKAETLGVDRIIEETYVKVRR